MFDYSRGENRHDNTPRQLRAESFADFQDAILMDRTSLPKERAPYFARAFAADSDGVHHRLTEFALPAAWIALDVDRLELAAVAPLNAILARKSGFWYASHSATETNAKRRVVLALSRLATVQEHPQITRAIEYRIMQRLGDSIRLDHAVSATVNRAWYLPTVSAASGTFNGTVVDVDALLAALPPPPAFAAVQNASARPDDDLRRAVLDGEDGQVYQALLSLSARLVGRGMDADDVVATLQGLLTDTDCVWRTRNPRVWRQRMENVPGMVSSAVDRFARDRRAVPAPVDRQAIHPGNGAGSGSVPTLTDIWPQLVTNSGGDKVIACFENAVKVTQLVLDQSSTICYRSQYLKRDQMIHGGIVRDITDRDVLKLYAEVGRLRNGLEKMSKEMISDAVLLIAERNVRDEMVEWLDMLRWDRVERLPTLCEDAFGAARNPLHVAACRNVMVACVARQYEPGIKFDPALILCGPQGIGKSMAIGELFGADNVCSMPHDPTNKDAAMKTAGKLCVELAELAALRRRDIEAIKDWMSTQVDEFRAPYAQRLERHPRRFIITGSTNAHEFLADTTGNRRFLPMDCGDINLGYLRETRDQLFAEAVMLYRNGFEFWKVPVIEARAAQDARVMSDPWQDSIRTWLIGQSEIRAEDALAHVVTEVRDREPGHVLRVAACLRAEHWEPFQARRDGKMTRRWRPETPPVPPRTASVPDENALPGTA